MSVESNHLARFVAEAREHLAVVGEAMIALERAPGDSPADRNAQHTCIERLLRSTHSLKGGAGFVGRQQIEKLAHATESALENIRDGLVKVSPDVIDVLLLALDRLTALVDDVEHSEEADISEPLARLRPLVDAEPKMTTAVARVTSPAASPATGPAASPAAVEPAEFPLSAHVRSASLEPGAALYGVKLDWHACESQLGLSPVEAARRLEAAGTVLDAQLDLAGPGIRTAIPSPPYWYRAIIASVLKADEFERRLAIPIAGIARLERVTSAQAGSKAAHPAAAPAAAHPAPTSLRISVSLIDRMMELAGELALVRNQAIRSTVANDAPMRRLMRRLDSVTSDLHDAALRMRMQPVATLFDRFPRTVRDLARQLGKQIELTIVGSEVELDKTVLETLADPLTHLIRNCCDHGIDTPDQRAAAGKPAGGTIRLSARQDRGQIVIEVRDDGRGIDVAAVKRKAIEQGLKTREELDRLTHRQVCDLILHSGFSTASRVTDLSGRGVGMDVVKTNLEQIGGVVEIDSTYGQGTVFSLRMPLTLAIMPCLLLRSGTTRYAIPQRDIEEVLLLDGGSAKAGAKVRIECSHDEEVLRLRDALLPAVRLHEVFAQPAPFNAAAWSGIIARYHGPQPSPRGRADGYAAVVRSGSRQFVVVFDEVIESEDIVVKPLNPLLRPLSIYSGSTILGDGGVAMILSAEGIARHTGIFQRAIGQEAPALPAAEAAERLGVLLTRYGQQLLAIPLSDIRRVIMVARNKIERVADRELVNVDGTTFNIIRLDAMLQLPSGTGASDPWSFLIVPRRGGAPAGILVAEIVDTEFITDALDRHAFAVAGVRGSAMVRDRIAMVLNLQELTVMWENSHAQPRRALPASPASPASPTASQPAAPVPRRVLLVEDTQFFQTLVGNCLRESGYEVVVAGNGREGLAALGHGDFSAVVSDIEMPIMDGLEFARQVRADGRYSHLPMLAVTMLNSDEHRRRALASGFDAYEIKFDRATFLAAVGRLLSEPARARPTTLALAGEGAPVNA